ncbi:MAG: hypothetical protein F4030_08475 [Gammaproteobacteria bacterium]|nr:hypothetical protein [Gammaproteobacteria bacterium]MYH85688.1 hypothetical protein [Gammaproteobacteria bacterium]MYK05004.1 hypothetical protein [Gammaproteobacteria bacterium]
MRFTRIASRFSLTAVLALLLAMSVFWLISSYHTRLVLQAQADRLGATVARQAAELLAEHVQADDRISINVILEELAADPAVIEVILFDDQGQRVSAAGAPNANPPIEIVTRPILRGEYYVRTIEFLGTTHGAVSVGLDLGYLRAALNDNLILIGGATLVMMLFAWLFVAAYSQVTLAFPLNLLSYSLGKMRRGEIVESPDVSGQDELANLTRQYNATANFLTRYTFLDRYDGETEPVDSAAWRSEEISLLVVRMSNYFSLATAMSRDHALQLLERYYFFAGQIARVYNGHISYCHEDEILISFDRASAAEEQACYAIYAGQLFLRLVEHLNTHPKGVRTNASFTLAAHSGVVPARLYSPVSGANDSLIGETPDRARQICNECPDNNLLISADCYQLAGADARVNADPFDAESDDAEVLLALEPPEEHGELLDSQAARLISTYPNR